MAFDKLALLLDVIQAIESYIYLVINLKQYYVGPVP